MSRIKVFIICAFPGVWSSALMVPVAMGILKPNHIPSAEFCSPTTVQISTNLLPTTHIDEYTGFLCHLVDVVINAPSKSGQLEAGPHATKSLW